MTQSQKEFKAYHVTYDENHYNDTIDHIEDALADKKLGINKVMPYLWVAEVGTTGKRHYHTFFYSSKSRNTVKKYLFLHAKESLSLSNPDDPKYKKYDINGIKGVEIYLHKGLTNHMCRKDDLKVYPRKIIQNNEYYGDINNETSRSYKIRKEYEKIIEEMRQWDKKAREIKEEKELTEFQLCLKDLANRPFMTHHEIRDYLIEDHYMRPKYIFNENGFKRLFMKILREKNEMLYKEKVEETMNRILERAFNI